MADQNPASWPDNVPATDLFLEDLAGKAGAESTLISNQRWLFERRLQYGVEFFKFHADQRMKMFQFFLVFVGLFAGAYATLLTKGYDFDSSLLGLIAAILTLFFLFLEHRNEELVHIAEDVLASLESDVLFARYERPIPWPRRRSLWRMGPRALTVRPGGIFRREAADIYGEFRDGKEPPKSCPNCSQGKEKDSRSKFEHGKWLPRLQLAILGLFVVLAVLPWLPPVFYWCGHSIVLKSESSK